MFALYVGGIFSAMAVAAVLKLWRGTVRPTPLIMELPPYRLPALRSLAQGLYERASIFIKRVGGIKGKDRKFNATCVSIFAPDRSCQSPISHEKASESARKPPEG